MPTMRVAPLDLRRGRLFFVLASAIVLLGACSAASPGASTLPGTAGSTPAAGAPTDRPATFPTDLPPVVSVPPTVPPVVGEAPADVVAAARADLAGSIGSEAAGAAEIVRSEAVTWPDGSLGCRQPGVFYEQIPVEGYQVVFALDGTQHDYRVTTSGRVVACDPGGPRP